MKISKDKIKEILNEKGELSLTEISRKYNLQRSKVKAIFKAAEKKTPKWFYLVLVLLPFIFLLLLEILLRSFNYGYNTAQWTNAGNGKLTLNPEIGKKYFSSIKFVPKTIEDLFDQEKKGNTFRVFVLGESSAEGYPYTPLGSFSRYIRKRLELTYPRTNIEVINISLTAVGSYTLLDLIPGVLEQKPDLILIYAGHNEYYGALGVGSTQSLGASRLWIRFMMYLDNFKITQLTRNSMNWLTQLFSSKQHQSSSSTLMSRMIKEQNILLNSDMFNKGLEQFRENLSSIFKLVREKSVPIIIGKLTSNVKDQRPFISIYTPGYGTANEVYQKAEMQLNKKNFRKADSLFKLAKDLDALRFRAPEKINSIIDELGRKFKVKTISIDSVFNANSPEGLAGNNLFVDHLHPNIRGYQLIGNAFYDVMEKTGTLPHYEQPKIPFEEQDSITQANFMFTKLDSAMGNNIVTLLKNDWPFSQRKKGITEILFPEKNFIDSISLAYTENKISWIDAHLKAATKYLKRDDVKEYLKYMDVIIYQYPNLKDLRTALKYFYQTRKIDPRDYTVKRMGLIALYKKNYKDAINTLTECYKINPADTKVLFSLAEGYYQIKDFNNALTAIEKCLKINPKYDFANNLKQQIKDSIKERI